MEPYRSNYTRSSGSSSSQPWRESSSSSSQERTQAAASPALRYIPPQSQQNQAKYRLDFAQLEKAKPYNESTFAPIAAPLTPDSFYEMDHDGVINTINARAWEGTFLPLSYLSQALSKFSGARYGTLSEAKSLFELTKEKHPREVSDKTLPDTIKLYSEMMWLYITRKDVSFNDNEQALLALYAECPAMETRDALLKYYNTKEKYDVTLRLYNEWPAGMKEGGYTLRYYMVAYKTTPGADVRKELRRLIDADPKRMEDVTFFVDFLISYFNRLENGYKASELPELLQFFEEYPHYKQVDKTRRELLRAFFDAKDIHSAENCFEEWPAGEMTQQSLEVMINGMAQINLEKALDIFANSAQPNGIFHESITINNKHIKIDLHNIKQTRVGSQRYGGDKDHLVVVKLWYLYKRLLPKMDANQWVSIQIVTGKGTEYIMRTFVSKILDNTFKWPFSTRGGAIEISGKAGQLRQLNVQLPPRIDESTPLFIFTKK